MTDLPRRLARRARREAKRAGPLLTAARRDPRSQQARQSIEQARMTVRAKRTSPDDVLDQIVADAIAAGGK